MSRASVNTLILPLVCTSSKTTAVSKLEKGGRDTYLSHHFVVIQGEESLSLLMFVSWAKNVFLHVGLGSYDVKSCQAAYAH